MAGRQHGHRSSRDGNDLGSSVAFAAALAARPRRGVFLYQDAQLSAEGKVRKRAEQWRQTHGADPPAEVMRAARSYAANWEGSAVLETFREQGCIVLRAEVLVKDLAGGLRPILQAVLQGVEATMRGRAEEVEDDW